MLLRILTAILDIRRHLGSDKKLLFCEICPTKIQASSYYKTERENNQNSLSYGRKISFSAILQIACEKLWEELLLCLYNIYTICGKK
jgi:hypothetical protein